MDSKTIVRQTYPDAVCMVSFQNGYYVNCNNGSHDNSNQRFPTRPTESAAWETAATYIKDGISATPRRYIP